MLNTLFPDSNSYCSRAIKCCLTPKAAIVGGALLVLIGALVVSEVPEFAHVGSDGGWQMLAFGAVFITAGLVVISDHPKVALVAGCIMALTGVLTLCGLPGLDVLGEMWGLTVTMSGFSIALPSCFSQYRGGDDSSNAFAYRAAPANAVREGLLCVHGKGSRQVRYSPIGVGGGGSRDVVEIDGGQVMMFPHRDILPATWERMVLTDVAFCQLLTELGIPNTQAEEATFSGKSVYVATNVSCLRAGRYLVLGNNQSVLLFGSPLARRKMKILDAEQLQYDFNTWLSVLSPLLQDLHKLAQHGALCLDHYSYRNFIMITQGNKPLPWLRYFGSHFASRSVQEVPSFALRDEDVREEVAAAAKLILEEVFLVQIGLYQRLEDARYLDLIEQFQTYCRERLPERPYLEVRELENLWGSDF